MPKRSSSSCNDSVPNKNKKPRFEEDLDCVNRLHDSILRMKITKSTKDATVTDEVSRWIALTFNRLTNAFILGTSVTLTGLIDAVTRYNTPTVDPPEVLTIYPESRLALFNLLRHTNSTGTLQFLDNEKDDIGAGEFIDSLDFFAHGGTPVFSQYGVSHTRLVGTSYQPDRVAEVAIVCVILIEMLFHEGHCFSQD